jgi:penicillin-binding protein 1A
LAITAIFTATVAGLFWIYGSDPNLPTIDKLSDYKPDRVTRVLSAKGEVIGEIFNERRTYVPFEEIPDSVIHAFISAEDSNFFQHKGLDYMGMVRALFVNIKTGKKKQGASTITQQVVKNFLLTNERSFKRKIQEIILARRLESSLSKQEILELYANEIFFGHGRYGIEEASRFYFGKSVKDLNPGEAALIAGLPKAPNRYSPVKEANRQRAKQRQIYVLSQMYNNGYLSKEEAQKYVDEPIQIISKPYPLLGTAPEWVELANTQLKERFGEEGIAKAGVNVVTSVDLEVQKLAREALRAGLRGVDERQKLGRAIKRIKKDKIDLELAKMARKLPKKGPVRGTVYRAIVTKVVDDPGEMLVDLGNWKAAILLDANKGRYNPEGKKPSERFGEGDIVKVMLPQIRPPTLDERRGPELAEREIELASGPQGAVVVMDPHSRRVLAVVGGYDTKIAGFNRATMAKRQAGSTFKPFVYAAAVDSGEFTAGSIVNDAPEVYNLWKPENYKKGSFEGPVRLRHALAKSINTVAIRVAHDVTPKRVADLAHALGIESALPDGLSLALGSGEVTPLEMTNAFATFAAGGKVGKPQVLKRIGEEELPPPQLSEVLRPQVAYITVDMMRSVVNGGTAGRAAVLNMDVAGKTGPTNDVRDAWFVGLSPKLAIGVWVGFDDFRRPLGRGESGGHTALPVYVDIMKQLGKRSLRFARPTGVAEARIDKATGLLAAEGVKKDTYIEVFLDGTAPVEVAPAPGEVDAESLVLDQYGDFEDDEDDDEEEKKDSDD